MSLDELEGQLHAFGETLQDRTGESIRPGAAPAPSTASDSIGRRRWSVLAAAAAVGAITIGGLLVVGGGDDDAVTTSATGPDRATTVAADETTPDASTVTATTLPTAPSTSEPGLVVREREPIVFSGAGSQRIEIPEDPIIGRLVGAAALSHDGSGPFQVVLVEDTGDGDAETVVVDTVGAYAGRRPWRLDQIDGPVKIPRTVEVTADGDWTLELIDVVQSDRFTRLELVDGGTVSGSGDDVIAPLYVSGDPAGGALAADFVCSGCAGDVDVLAIGDRVQVIADQVADGGRSEGTGVLTTSGWLLLVVQTASPGAPGEWMLTVRAR